ncbi:Alpha/Beta hydrolase protein [Lasiosphaeria ovina]|uniref:Alpha/Beta hydrolase protein n=1 Tax=Lasiosphaeria ovina TaxID=92902 RepID=A0AAE0KI12_9PEZI|nr:Alpha/Beta hydrolase protein [Lasiosphaeria ovina]
MNKLLLLSLLWQAVQPAFAVVFNSTSCTAQCQALGNLASSYEASQRADASLKPSFYNVPSNFSRKLAPGSLLKVEYVTDPTNYTVPYSLSMSRILYTTTDLNGTVQPASAYILWPYTAAKYPNSKGFQFPMVAWAHGTSGSFGACGPSNYKALQYHFMVPYAIAEQGIAVVAPDYAGLGVNALPDGTPVLHPYSGAPAQANDLANAVIAARAAFPANLPKSNPFVVAGHSQGGGVAWAFAERQARQPVAGYRGTVAFAPALRAAEWVTQILKDPAQANSSEAIVSINIVAGVTAAYPAYNYRGLSAVGYDRWHNVLAPVQGCLTTQSLALADVAPANLTRAGWYDDATVREFVSRTRLGGKAFAGPLLVIEGELDSAVPPALLAPVVNETCAFLAKTHSAEQLDFVVYGKMNHFPVIQASQGRWMAWVKERLLAAPSKGSRDSKKTQCTTTRVDGFRPESAVTALPEAIVPNWIVSQAAPTEHWKYSL